MLATNAAKRWNILLVDDSARDVRLTREALRASGVDAELTAAGDGEEALRRLRRQRPYEDVPLPDLIFLDINLPRKNGRDVLREIKQDARLSLIPVLMLTTSAAESDLLACYHEHANSYIKKPLDFDEFVDLLRSVCDYWVRRVVMPTTRIAA